MPIGLSPQEEETFALAAVEKLGEASAHEVAVELGVEVIRHTLGRLVDKGRLVRERARSSTPGADRFVYRVAPRWRVVPQPARPDGARVWPVSATLERSGGCSHCETDEHGDAQCALQMLSDPPRGAA